MPAFRQDADNTASDTLVRNSPTHSYADKPSARKPRASGSTDTDEANHGFVFIENDKIDDFAAALQTVIDTAGLPVNPDNEDDLDAP